MAAADAFGAPPVDPLTRERRQRPRAGMAALLAAVLVVGSSIALQALTAKLPHVYFVESLRSAAGQSIGRAGLRTTYVEFLNDKSIGLILVAVASSLAIVALGFALLFLHGAAADRGAPLSRATRGLLLFGIAAIVVGDVGREIAMAISAHDFVTSADHGTKAARDAVNTGPILGLTLVGDIGRLVFAIGMSITLYRAMSVGLLTRFLGILGMIVAILMLASQGTFIVQAFWLLLLGVLLLGRWPSGMPPAWTRGEAVPWPSRQELLAAGAAGGAAVPEGVPGGAPRKRKRRA